MSKQFFPREFREKYSELLGVDFDSFFEACSRKVGKSIWVNSLKTEPRVLVESLEDKGWVLSNLGFHENAFSVEGVVRPGQCEEFKVGLFNLQEKASMIPALALNPLENDLVLDATAAPGNKTLQLACLMKGKGRIVAVEKNVVRFKSLRFNMRKFGCKSVVCKRMDLLDSRKSNVFDKVLLDAPCSSEGLVRSKLGALKNWSQSLVESKALLQKKLVLRAFDLLKRGGFLVYSTCSFSLEENEFVVEWLLRKRRAFVEAFSLSGFRFRSGFGWAVNPNFSDEISKCVRVFPQDNDSQQFFLARIRKL